jgi:hypothetical protein
MAATCEMTVDGQWTAAIPEATEEGGHDMGIEFYRGAEWTNANAPAFVVGLEFTMSFYMAAGSGEPGTDTWVEVAALASNDIKMTAVDGASTLVIASAAVLGYLAF